MTPLELAARFGTALGLGLLLGLERERTQAANEEHFAGARTFALFALLGAISTHLQLNLQIPWAMPAAFGAVGAIVLASYVITSRDGNVGATTEVSALLTFSIGALCGAGEVGLAAALAVVTLLLLSIKPWSRELARHIEAADVEAVLKFAIITVIILPLLPSQTYGPEPLNVLNPYKIWLMVVLISGLNFASYVLVKVLGPEHGIGLTGLLGGLVSSTAVTLGFTQRSRTEPHLAPSLTLGILISWTIMFFRVVVAIALIDVDLALRLAPGMGLLGAVSIVLCAILFFSHRTDQTGQVATGANPFELRQAMKFGFIFALVLVMAKIAQLYLGSTGLYLAGAVGGLTDLDAISLSMANLAQTRPDLLAVAARTVVIASMSNTMAKAVMAVSGGAPELRKRIAPFAAILLMTGIGAALLVG